MISNSFQKGIYDGIASIFYTYTKKELSQKFFTEKVPQTDL